MAKRGVTRNKGVVMQRRVFLLFILFLVLAVFYSSVARENVPGITSKQQAQTELLNRLDESVLEKQEEEAVSSSGN